MRKGKITNYFNYTSSLRDGKCNAKRTDGKNELLSENEKVGGSGGKNDDATILKWRAMMAAPSKRVKPKTKSLSKPSKRLKRGAKSINGEGLGTQAKLGKTDSSQLELRRNLDPGVMGNSQGSSNRQGYAETKKNNSSYSNHCMYKTVFDKGNKILKHC